MPITVVTSLQGVGRFTPQFPGKTDPDGSDIIQYMFSDAELGASSVVKNLGSTGSVGDLSVRYGSPVLQAQGVFSNRGGGITEGAAMFCSSTAVSGFHTANDTTALSSSLEPPAPLTWSGWVLLRAQPTQNTSAFSKAYRLANQGWSSPFNTCLIVVLSNSLNCQWQFTKGGGSVVISGNRRLNLNVWHHTGWTYDGTTMIAYLDGDEVGRVTNAGTVDYGNRGPYYASNNYINSGDLGSWVIQDVRIANVVRPLSYFQNVYETAVMQFGA
jgi:hypothetical protein